MLSAGALSSKACIVRRPVVFATPKASTSRIAARPLVRAEGEAEAEAAKVPAKKAKAANLR